MVKIRKETKKGYILQRHKKLGILPAVHGVSESE